MHRSTSLPDLADAVAAVAADRRQAAAVTLVADALDRAAHECRVDGDHTGYVLGFQAARALSALHFLVRDGGAGLAEVAYEAVMVCGATEPVIAELVGGRR